MDNKDLHTKMSKHVVAIKIKVETVINETKNERVVKTTNTYDGTVLSSQQNCLYIIASSKLRDKIDNNLIEVQLPNGTSIPIQRECFDMVANDDESGIVGIRCSNPTLDVNCGFEDLEPISICEDLVQERQRVYTYSRHIKQKLLTPGSVMLVEEGSFDHSCVRYQKTHTGTPVVNVRGQLLGFNFSHNGYLTAYNISEVAARIERNQGRQLMRTSVTFQHLRQQCRAIQVRITAGHVECKIQKIGEPVTSASWKNLEEFRQQNNAFQVEEEIQNVIDELAAASRFRGNYYGRRGRPM